MGESEIKVMDSEEEKCNFQCHLSQGEFCLGSQCVRCSHCPDDPFDVDQRGRLIVYRPCIRYGFCPKICSSYLALGSNPRANATLCQRIRKPKATKPRTTQPVSTTVYENTTSGSPNATILLTSDRIFTGTSPVVPTTNISEGSTYFLELGLIAVATILALVFMCTSVKLYRKLSCCKKRSSTSNTTDEAEMFVRKYKPLEIQLDHQNKTATVKGLQGLECNALQLCACLHSPCYPAQNWMRTRGVDEMQLPGVMIPQQVYTVKAGRVTNRREFECIAEGKVNTEEFVNVTLDEACSTTLKDIFENICLRRSLELELNCSSQRDMADIIATALELTEDEGKCFKGQRCLEKLYNETLTANDVVDREIHLLMEVLAQEVEAKDFVRKIAKRDTKKYCKKCLELLHRMCRWTVDDISEVVSENQA